MDNNKKMDLFISIFLLIIDGKITFQRTKAQPLMPYQTLIQPNNFRKKCKEFVSFYDIPWNHNSISPSKIHRKYQKDKLRSSKIFNSFINCLKSIQCKLKDKKYAFFKPQNCLIASYNLHSTLNQPLPTIPITATISTKKMSTMATMSNMHNYDVIKSDNIKKEPTTLFSSKQNHPNHILFIDNDSKNNFKNKDNKLNRLSLSRVDSGCSSSPTSNISENASSTSNLSGFSSVCNDEISLPYNSMDINNNNNNNYNNNGLSESMNKMIEYVMSQDIHHQNNNNNLFMMNQNIIMNQNCMTNNTQIGHLNVNGTNCLLSNINNNNNNNYKQNINNYNNNNYNNNNNNNNGIRVKYQWLVIDSMPILISQNVV